MEVGVDGEELSRIGMPEVEAEGGNADGGVEPFLFPIVFAFRTPFPVKFYAEYGAVDVKLGICFVGYEIADVCFGFQNIAAVYA